MNTKTMTMSGVTSVLEEEKSFQAHETVNVTQWWTACVWDVCAQPAKVDVPVIYKLLYTHAGVLEMLLTY